MKVSYRGGYRMISKHFSIACDECAKIEHLYGQTVKACEDEARNMGWNKEPGKGGKKWFCPVCDRNMAHTAANAPETSQEPE
jgi:hypothetical protein